MGGLSTESAAREAVKAALTVHDLPADLPPASVDQAIAEIESQIPLKHGEPGLDGQISRLIEDMLRPIGASIDPRLSGEQAKAWRKALLLKLSNLPGVIVLKATKRAIHDSFQFFNEVEPSIRKHAKDAQDQQRVALMRLERWRRELERAANPPPVLEAPPEEPITREEVDRLNTLMRSIRSKQRWRLEDGEAVLFELEEPEEPEEPTENSPV